VATPPLPSELEDERRALNTFLDQNPGFSQRLGDFVTQLKRKDFLGTLLLARETLDLVLVSAAPPAAAAAAATASRT
jgi:hypothetical protein